ncbi:MAG: GNAT family N-acetyltransferase [bacterium]|nr:GNAT family N-acetyltransferase [bacterium]
MTELPLTRIAASKERQARIRDAVSKAENLAGIARVAREGDVDALTALLSDPQISEPIYTLPGQIDQDTVANFIEQHLAERECGEGLLMVSTDESGVASAYYDIQFWPQWAACELGGAIRRDRQASGQGGTGATVAFGWLFEVIGVDLICETAALDNARTARLLERIGFTYKGEIESKLSGGGMRPSRYWELARTDWSSHSISGSPR